MDIDAIHMIALLLTLLSYVGTFILGYAMHAYVYSHKHPDHSNRIH